MPQLVQENAGRAGATQQDLSGLIASPGEWAVTNTPAAAAQATASRAAGAAGSRHKARSITVSVASGATPQTTLQINLRDGATGVGTILWSALVAVLAGDSKSISVADLNIVGSPATPMTLETAGATAATCTASVTLTGYTVGA